MQRKADKMSFLFFYYFCVYGGLLGYAEYQRGTGKYLGHCNELEHFSWLQICSSGLVWFITGFFSCCSGIDNVRKQVFLEILKLKFRHGVILKGSSRTFL